MTSTFTSNPQSAGMKNARALSVASIAPVLGGVLAIALMAGCSSLNAAGRPPSIAPLTSNGSAGAATTDTSLTNDTLPPGLGGGGDDDGGVGDGGIGDGGPGFPGGRGFGQGTPLLGDAYNKAQASALAKYPGTIQTIEQLADGTIVVHVIQADGSEVHVLEDKNYVVTGIDSGPGGGEFPGGPQQATPTTFNA
jgi:hypothetical protein